MKLFSFFLFIIIYSFSIYSTEISTFKLSHIIDNSLEFNEFINKLNTLKTRMQNELQEDENKLIDEKSEYFGQYIHIRMMIILTLQTFPL
mgnify:CR=1 FL=1